MAHTYFLMRLPEEPEKVLVWDTRTLSIGRAPENAIVLAESDVSRKHAIFMKEGDRCAVGDHQTGNGTFVNGERVSGSQSIRSGDKITVGKLELEFYETDEHPAKLGKKLDYASHRMTAGMMPAGANPNATMVGIMDSVPGDDEEFVIEHNDGTGSDLFADDVLDLDVAAPAKTAPRNLDFEFGDTAPPPQPQRQASAPAPDPNDASDGGDPVERMRRLKSLHAEGLITDDEFQQKRAEILKGV